MSITLVPTGLGPVGLGAATVWYVVKADRRSAAAVGLCPLPDKGTCWGVSVLSSLMEIVVFLVPVAVGLKITVIVQDCPVAMFGPQVFV
jgi:hypothetical protein